MQPIYLDNNATTPLLPEASDAMRACAAQGAANPASQHALGRQARALLEGAREGIARLLGADIHSVRGDSLVFTSGGTEANHLAIVGFATQLAAKLRRSMAPGPQRLVISAIEHPSVVGAAEHLTELGWQVERLPVDRQGVVQLDALPALLAPPTRLVSVMLGNNETGVLQPVAEIARLASAAEVAVHTDATQVVGKLPVDLGALGVSLLTCAAHKFHGPRGIGALVIRRGVEIAPLLRGGFQQAGLRPGTESVELVVGMHTALAAFARDADSRTAQLAQLRDRLETGLRNELTNIVVHGTGADRLPHTSNISFPGLDRQGLFMALDLTGVCCSTGSACASGSSEPSPVLVAMRLADELVASALRFSVGQQNTPAEVDDAIHRIASTCRTLRERGSAN